MYGQTPFYGETPSIEEWPEVVHNSMVGFAGIGYAEEEGEPEEWENWEYSPVGFGQGPDWGIIQGAALGGIGIEVDDDVDLVRTPLLEIAPDDYAYVSFVGRPYPGMFAMGDDGDMYEYDGTLGFFKKLFKRVKRGFRKAKKWVKKGIKKVGRGIKKVLKKTKFGRFLIKVGKKLKKVAMKIVKPLMKWVGKWASKLAPIAAMIPGYGTAIAAGLAAAGRVAKLMNKFGVTTKGKKGKVRGLKLKNPKALPGFQKALKREAGKMKSFSRKNPRKFKEMLLKQKQRLARR